MKLYFNNIINRELNKNAIVMGTGASLTKHLECIYKNIVPNNNWITIGCNDIDKYTNINPTYWMFANSEATIAAFCNRLNNSKSTIVYADSVDLTPRDAVDKILTVDYLPYDQRHFSGNKCSPESSCCKHIIDGRLTIQEELQKYTGHNCYYTKAGTVAVHMLALAVLLGCKNIYITGVDLDYTKGYVNNQDQKIAKTLISNSDGPIQNKKRILTATNIIYKSITGLNSNIFCLDGDTPLAEILPQSIPIEMAN